VNQEEKERGSGEISKPEMKKIEKGRGEWGKTMK